MKNFLKNFVVLIILLHSASANETKPPHEPLTENIGGDFRLVTVAVPDGLIAAKFARALVMEGLAATVNIINSATSVYVWNGQLREIPEILLFVYTHASQYKNIEDFVRKNHVHIEPGVVSFPISGGSESFLRWLYQRTVKNTPVNQGAAK